MLNIKVDDGHALVMVKANGLQNIAYELLTAVRGVIEGVAEKDKNAGECLLKFCQELLPQLADPEMDSDDVSKVMDKAIEKAQKEAKAEREAAVKELKDVIGGDEDIMQILKAILEDDKK